MKCIIYKTKDVVDNSNLLSLDAFKITVSKQYEIPVIFYYTGTIKVMSDYSYTVDENTYDANIYHSFETSTNSTISIYLSESTQTFIVDGKSNITIIQLNENIVYGSTANTLESFYRLVPQYLTDFQCNHINEPLNIEHFINVNRIHCESSLMTGDITKCTKCYSFNINGTSVSGDIGTISGVTQYFNVNKSQCTGSIVEFFNSNYPENVDLVNVTGVYGNIEECNINSNIKNIYLSGTSVTGDIAVICEKLFTNGKTTGSIIIAGNDYMTLNGETFNNTTTVTFSTDGVTYN